MFAVSAVYAGLLGLLLVVLAALVVRRRGRDGVLLGTGGDPGMEALMRAHGNAAEWIPIGLILLALAEGMAAPTGLLHVLGLMLLAGRVIHAAHLAGGLGLRFRLAGMILTITMVVIAALFLIAHGAMAAF